jgi:hypothetical protein
LLKNLNEFVTIMSTFINRFERILVQKVSSYCCRVNVGLGKVRVAAMDGTFYLRA